MEFVSINFCIIVVESIDLESSMKQLNEIMSKISSSLGYSRIFENFVLQKEKEKLTIFPLGIWSFHNQNLSNLILNNDKVGIASPWSNV